MNFINKNGNEVHQNFIAKSFDIEMVKKVISEDETELPGGYPKLWYSVYGNKVYIENLLGVKLKEYEI